MSTFFLPSKHSWPFDNCWPANWIMTNANLFGLPIGMPIQTGFGLCGGMCWSALDRFYHREVIDRNLNRPSGNSNLINEIAQRQTDSIVNTGLWDKVYDYQTRPDTGHWNREHSLRHMVKTVEFPRLKESLDQGKPIQLCLIRVDGYTANFSKNHQVLAYDYNYNSSTKDLSISVYDPNHPSNDDVKLIIDFRGRFLDAKQSTGEKLRGFFVIPYDRNIPRKWYISDGGTGQWQELNTSGYKIRQLAFGDFNDDGKTDVFRADGRKWYVSWGGTSGWQELNTSGYKVHQLAFGDFNGDGKTDPFVTGVMMTVPPR